MGGAIAPRVVRSGLNSGDVWFGVAGVSVSVDRSSGCGVNGSVTLCRLFSSRSPSLYAGESVGDCFAKLLGVGVANLL